MAEQPATQSLTIDGKVVELQPGELIIAAAERVGTHIPRFCYHPRMRSVGMCRMCLVEVKGPRGFALQPACFLTATDGMEIITNSDKVKKAQDGVLEFLLANHPLDCPVCDKGGECPLQDQTLAHGSGETRFIEEKRHFAKPISISPLILLDRERCIQCDRCTRFANEVAGEALINFVGRGAHIEVATFPDAPFASYFSGNVAQICPVGALTTTPYRFKARPWDLEQVTSTCPSCALGCQIAVQSSQNQLTRYLGIDSEAVNHSWLCDKGRFALHATNDDARLTVPLIRKADSHVEISWSEALSKVAKAIEDARAKKGGGSIGLLGGAHYTNEDLFAWYRLASEVIETTAFDPQLGDGVDPSVILREPRATINEALSASVLVIATGDIREELPVLYLRLREAVASGLRVIDIGSTETSQSKLAKRSIRYLPGEFGELTSNIDMVAAAHELGANDVGEDGEGLVFLVGRGDLGENGSDRSLAFEELLDRYPKAKTLSGLRRANTMGALQIAQSYAHRSGQSAVRWRDARETLLDCVSGAISVLFVLSADILSDFPDRQLVLEALEGVEMVVSLDGFETATSARANIVLPVAVPGEVAGTTTNIEGRVSLVSQKLVPKGLAQPPWLIAADLAERLGTVFSYESSEDIWKEMIRENPLYGGITREVLEKAADGVVVPLRRRSVGISRRILDPIATPGIASVLTQAPVPSVVAERPEVATPTDAVTPKATLDISSTRVQRSLSQPVRPTQGELALVIVSQLYDGGAHQRHVRHLAGLGRSGSIQMSVETAQGHGVSHGDRVTLKPKGGREPLEVIVEVSSAVPLGVGRMEMSSELPIVQLIDSSYNMTVVELERV